MDTSRSRHNAAASDSKLNQVLTWIEHWPSPLVVLAILLALVFLLWAVSVSAETLSGLVVGVSDGDTVTVLDADNRQHKIRLAGIDAPEKKQAFGDRSKQHLSYLVFGKPVNVDWKKHDRYGRIVGKVLVAPPDACPDVMPDCPRTLDAGLALITVGLAWHYKEYEREQSESDRRRYSFTEIAAKGKRVGLWKDAAPVPQWEFRGKVRPPGPH